MAMSITGGEIVAEYLIAEGVPYVCGIPGHGDMALFDAFKDRADRISVIAPRHEQAATHIADAHFRAGGGPLATMTSIGPGSVNQAVGLATAFSDSIPLIAFTGGPQTYMLGRGVLQELEHGASDNTFPDAMRPLVKRAWNVQRTDLLADVLPRAFNSALTGRPGPVHIELPMDVQAQAVETTLPDPRSRRAATNRVRPDADAIDRAAEVLLAAERPVILAGGGCLHAEAAAELRAVAERLDAAVVATMMGKGAFPEDHPLAAEHTGSNGTLCGNHMTREADVILAVGTRFAEQTCSSYAPGRSFTPGTTIVHLDIDPREIGKNYPTEVGAVCDARSGLADLLDALVDRGGATPAVREAYRAEIAEQKRRWHEAIRGRWTDALSMSRVLHEVREASPRETIAIASAGHPQIQAFQEFLCYEPRTWISPGGYSTMGFTLPAAIGAKLAQPDRPVVGFAGDGDLQQTIQELALAAELGLPIVIACLNNTGWLSIRDFQRGMFGEERAFSVEFRARRGDRLMPVDFVAIAKAFNCEAERVTQAGEVGPAMSRAYASGGPYLVEFDLSRKPVDTENINAGHWDLPRPAYLG